MIPYGRQDISPDDVRAVAAALQSDFLTQGPCVPRFEAAIAARVGADHVVAVNSGTSALHIACLALGVGRGDMVWTSPITFVASANCALYCGAEVDFVDIDPRTFNMSVPALAQKLERAKAASRLPKVVIPVDMCGQSCDMAGIAALRAEYGFHVIEDASHAIGARYRGSPVGRGDHADITVFSFHPVKIITTAEGGAGVTNDRHLADRMRLFRSHGITRDPSMLSGAVEGDWYYEQIELGYNYRMTDVQASLGISQLARIDEFLERRRALACRYDEALRGLPVVPPFRHPDAESAWHLYVIRLSDGAKRRAKVFAGMRARGVGVNVHYIPVHTQPYYRRLGFSPGSWPESERYYREALTLPLHARLTDAEQDQVVSALRQELLTA
jgi:UDP-4-amino-4,6-dideoxy-N-acetyl-beta-L-altrosamine transaminase